MGESDGGEGTKEREKEERRRKKEEELKKKRQEEMLEETQLSDEEIVEALNKAVGMAVVVGQHSGKEFSVRVKLVEKTRRKWRVEVVGEDQGVKLESLPSDDYRLEITAIYDHEGVRISKSPWKRSKEEKEEEEQEARKKKKPILDGDIVEELYQDKIGPSEAQTPGFWNRQGLAPSLPDILAGPWLKKLKKAERKTEMDWAPMVKMGLAKETRMSHQRKLRDLEYLRPLEGEFLVSCLLRYFQEEYRWRKWEGSTLCGNMASTQGALANLPLYRLGMAPILLKVSPEWRLGLKGAGSLARRRGGVSRHTPNIATLAHVRKAMNMEPNKVTRAAVELGWNTAARGGCIIHLRTGNVKVDDQVTSVKFAQGKTASFRPYSVHTAPVSWETQDYIEERRKKGGEGSWLFPGLRGEHIKKCLRRADPRLEQRSLRRGAIQHLAEGGMKDKDLLHVSQHRIMDTLNRYLEFGWLTGEKGERARKAGGLGLGNEGKVRRMEGEDGQEGRETETEEEEEEDTWESQDS